MSRLYESMLKEMRDAAGDSGEFYTPRPVVRFMVRVIDPQLGDTIHDPACGTAGFLVEAYKYLKQNCQPKDWKLLRSCLSGVEAKSLPYLLAQINLLLHGVEYPDVERKNSLASPINQIGVKDQVDIILTNPPLLQTAETALLFLQLIMRLLKEKPQPGRAGVVVPNGTLFSDGACAKVKEKLLMEYTLHTSVRLPNGSFAPYTSIPTNLLFFDASQPTEDIWYYEIPLPPDRKSFTKTKPIGDTDFADCLAWWNNRTENDRAWKYTFRPAYEKAKADAQPHWDAARVAEATASQLAKRVKELEAQIQTLNASLLDFTPKPQQTKLKKQIAALKQEQQEAQTEERQQRDRAKQEQVTGDSLYWYIYNLDQKNPSKQTDFEHLPPEQLVANIWQKEERILAILAEIKDVLKAPPSNGEEDA